LNFVLEVFNRSFCELAHLFLEQRLLSSGFLEVSFDLLKLRLDLA